MGLTTNGGLAVTLTLLLTACRSQSPSTPTPVAGRSCGEERWAVKTLSDRDALRVNLTPVISTTVAAMNALTPHCSNLPQARTFAEEFRVHELTGKVTLVRLEDDGDYHIALSDPAAPDQTMIVESVDPTCEGAASSPRLTELQTARAMFVALHGGQPTSLVGQTVRVQVSDSTTSTTARPGGQGAASNCIPSCELNGRKARKASMCALLTSGIPFDN